MDFYDILMAAKIGGKGGGGGSTIQVEPLSVTHNGTYTPDTGKAYGPVDVNVAAPIPTSMALTATQNGQYAPDDHGVEYFNQVTVAVPTPIVGSLHDIIGTSGTYDYLPSSYGYEYFDRVDIQVDVTPPEPPTPSSTSLTVTENGSYSPSMYACDYFGQVDVSVPTYDINNIGEVVVDDGSGNLSLAQQTSETYTQNGVYDTTTISSVTVKVPIPTSATSNDVNFIDYDGTIVYSYSKADFLALNALPTNPIHTGLTSQGWNWSLADAKTYVTTYDKLNIGQMYVTDDGKTRYYIKIADVGRMDFQLVWSQTVSKGVEIDWGDGSAVETLIGTNTVFTTHTYATIGDYTITLNPVSGNLGLAQQSGRQAYKSMIQKVEIGSTLTSIADNAFYYCYSLTSITIPSSVTSIGDNAFNSCYSLTSITIPSSVTSIGGSAFYFCYSLTSITIPSSVTSIGGSAFYYCHSFASITLPSSVTSIGNRAFSGCNALASLTIPSGVTSIGNSTFQNCSALTSLTIPSSVTSIADNAFYYCYSLASLTIPSSVTSIGEQVFSGCNALALITIPSGVTSIGNSTFQFCYSLASLTIPSSVTSIGTFAFNGCSSMAEYHLLPTTPPALGADAFNGIVSDCKIYVPYSADHSVLTAYQSATNWANYASRIQEEPQS